MVMYGLVSSCVNLYECVQPTQLCTIRACFFSVFGAFKLKDFHWCFIGVQKEVFKKYFKVSRVFQENFRVFEGVYLMF